SPTTNRSRYARRPVSVSTELSHGGPEATDSAGPDGRCRWSPRVRCQMMPAPTAISANNQPSAAVAGCAPMNSTRMISTPTPRPVNASNASIRPRAARPSSSPAGSTAQNTAYSSTPRPLNASNTTNAIRIATTGTPTWAAMPEATPAISRPSRRRCSLGTGGAVGSYGNRPYPSEPAPFTAMLIETPYPRSPEPRWRPAYLIPLVHPLSDRHMDGGTPATVIHPDLPTKAEFRVGSGLSTEAARDGAGQDRSHDGGIRPRSAAGGAL